MPETPFTDSIRQKIGDLPAGVSVFDSIESRFAFNVARGYERTASALGVDVEPIPEAALQEYKYVSRAAPVNAVLSQAARYAEVASQSEQPKKNKNWWGKVLDAGGNVFEPVMDALSWPGDQTEKAVGSGFLWSADKLGLLDLPDGVSAWELGSLTWDLAFDFRKGRSFHQLAADMHNGMSWEDAKAKYENPWLDMAGKIVLDPLWLLGGLGLAAKSSKAIQNSSKFSRLVKHGLIGGAGALISPAKSKTIQVLGDIPVLGVPIKLASRIIGTPPKEQVLQDSVNSMERMARQIRTRKVGGTNEGGTFRNLIRLSHHSLANESYRLGMLWTIHFPQSFGGTTPREALSLISGLASGDRAAVPTRFGRTVRESEVFDMTHELYSAAGITKAEDLPSVKKLLNTVSAADLDDPAKLAEIMGPVWSHMHSRIMKSAGDSFGVDISESANKLFSAMKTGLALTTLNRPGFAVINLLENSFKVLWDSGLGIFKGGYGIIPRYGMKRMKTLGLEQDAVQGLVPDATTMRAMFGMTKHQKPNVRQRVMDLMTWPIHLASETDLGGRLTMFQEGFEYAIHFNEQSLPHIPDAIKARLPKHLVDSLEGAGASAARTGDDVIAQLRTAIDQGTTWTSVRPIVREFLTSQGWSDDAAKTLEKDWIELSESIDDGLRTVDNIDEFNRLIDQTAGDYVSKIHKMRDSAFLDPIGRIRVGFNSGEVANLDEMLRHRSKSIVDDISRYMRAHSIPGFRPILNKLDDVYQSIERDREAMWTGLLTGRESTTADNLRVFEQGMHDRWKEAATELWDHVNKFSPRDFHVVEQMLRHVWQVEESIGEQLINVGLRVQDTVGPQTLMGGWDNFFDTFTAGLNTELRFRKNFLGMRPRSLYRQYRYGQAADVAGPSLYDAQSMDMLEKVRFLINNRGKLADLYRNPVGVGDLSGLNRVERNQLLEWADELALSSADLRIGALNTGREMANWTMLNYDRLYGFEDTAKWLFPWLVWPSRSMQRWLIRGAANPGRFSVMADLSEVQERLTESLPVRFKQVWKVPVIGPIIGQATGMVGSFFFDPIAIMASPVQFAKDFEFEERKNTVPGAILDYVSSIGPSVNPLIPRALGIAGMGLDRQAWLGSNWFNALPFGMPATGAVVGLRSLFGADEQGDYEDELLGRKLTPEYWLRKVLNVPEDKWDPWRINRAAAGLMAQEAVDIREKMTKQGASKEEINAVIQAEVTEWTKELLTDERGPRWQRARKFASKEAGLRWLSSWAVGMPLSAYPDGERIQRGLDMQFREAARQGLVAEFYDAYPEYKMWTAAKAGIEDPRELIVSLTTDQMYAERGQVLDEINPEIDEFEDQLFALRTDETYLQTEHGRFILATVQDAITAKRNERRSRLAEVDAAFPDANRTPSRKGDPRIRSLRSMENEYYDLYDVDLSHIKDENDREERLKTMQREFVEALPTKKGELSWLELGMATHLVRNSFSVEISTAFREDDFEKADALRAKQDEEIDRITDLARSQVTQQEFQRHLDRNGLPLTPAYATWLQARDEFLEFLAILDNTDIPERERNAAAFDYRDAHPLIDRFYGLEDTISRRNIAAAERLDEFRKEYYDHTFGEARMDFLFNHLDEYNEDAELLGLKLVDPVELGILPPKDQDDTLMLPGVMPDSAVLRDVLTGRYDRLFSE